VLVHDKGVCPSCQGKAFFFAQNIPLLAARKF